MSCPALPSTHFPSVPRGQNLNSGMKETRGLWLPSFPSPSLAGTVSWTPVLGWGKGGRMTQAGPQGGVRKFLLWQVQAEGSGDGTGYCYSERNTNGTIKTETLFNHTKLCYV